MGAEERSYGSSWEALSMISRREGRASLYAGALSGFFVDVGSVYARYFCRRAVQHVFAGAD